jgi:pimeloyl-ACP methyl ester carboxylesterase
MSVNRFKPSELSVHQEMSSIATAFAPRSCILPVFDGEGEHLPYLIYIPDSLDPDKCPLVSVHGWTRNVVEHAIRLRQHADMIQTALIVPLFSKASHKHYQRLEIRSAEKCPAKAFNQMLEDVHTRFGIATDKISLFGFSGGAQFAHRYTLMYPGRVGRLALMAAGWFTMPDHLVKYPYGLASSKTLGERCLHLEKALEIPTLVLVGSQDLSRDRSLRTERRIDRVQGRTRIERAENWTNAMNEEAASRRLPQLTTLHIIENATHDFRNCVEQYGMGELVADWFLSGV